MPENVPNPISMLSAAPQAKLRSANTVRSRMGSLALSSWIRKPRSATTATIASATIVDELQAAEAGHHQPEARPVDPGGPAQVRRIEQERAGQEEAQDADREVDVEDPAPRPLVGQIAADGRPQDRPEDEAEAPHRHREPALMEREDLPQDRLRERNDRPAAEALEDARDDQRRQVGRRAGDERAQHEHR